MRALDLNGHTATTAPDLRTRIAGALDIAEPQIEALRERIASLRAARAELDTRRLAGDQAVQEIADRLAGELGVRPRRPVPVSGLRSLLARIRPPSSTPTHLEPAVLDRLTTAVDEEIRGECARLAHAEGTAARLRAFDLGLEMTDVSLAIAADVEAIRDKTEKYNQLRDRFAREHPRIQGVPTPRPVVSQETMRAVYQTLLSLIGLDSDRGGGTTERTLALTDASFYGVDVSSLVDELDTGKCRVGPILANANRAEHEIENACKALESTLAGEN